MITSTSHQAAWRYPVLIADIGGTNARFALLVDAHAALPEAVVVTTEQYAGLGEALSDAVLARTSLRPRTAIIAMAGPITGDRIHLTNAPWIIEPRALIEALGLETVILLNDFEAQALALPGFGEDDLQQIGGGGVVPHAAKVVIGPGTGLGAGALIHAADRWIPVPGEGGHVELGPLTDEEYALWPHIERNGTGKNARIGAEQILSGHGMVRLARACAALKGVPQPFASPRDIVEAAEKGDPLATQTLEHFSMALGRIAGDMALIFMALGGVYLAGGIPPRIARALDSGAFRQAFEAKAPHEAIMADIATFIVHHPQAALDGLASFARTPSRFAVDLIDRMWRAA
ncbi:ROK family protein [Breoghania sp. L-A4]|uniref:ROK family protein n=1 Tax=Breoghania sp. L-A4 TaxID=2304600 RepID=UPI000E35A02F|nr:ROK family protein [Breoghania sp. L-A4]AXS39207.1 ROK family protein [Breoghania sp. L-A4]